jgi:hypothetical protein
MPSSGYPMENIFHEQADGKEAAADVKFVLDAAEVAMKHGLFPEWLECFVGAWNKTKDVRVAAWAGLEEWDM